MSFETALSSLLEKVSLPAQMEKVALHDALDRVLADDICSPINVPGYDNSAMDGYALRAQDLANTSHLTLVGKSFAGAPYAHPIKPGECVRIMTGAKIPDGADCVVMQEKTSQQATAQLGEIIEFYVQPQVGENIRRAGEDIHQAQNIFHKGHKIRVPDIGLLASLGLAELPVYPKLKVAVFSTGDEIRKPGEPLVEGQIYDSNRFTNLALLSRLNCEVKDLGVLPDNKDAIREALLAADAWADVVMTSGGVSVGEADHIKPLVSELGRLELWKIAIKPGKPFAYGKLPRAHFIGLPGNPVSALVTLYQLAVPMLKKLQGIQPTAHLHLTARCRDTIKKSPGRKEFQRGIVAADERGELWVTTTGAQGSGILSSMSKANCFIILDAEQGTLNQGEPVKVELFDELLR
jgi:molybdopterin molybdotransferase